MTIDNSNIGWIIAAIAAIIALLGWLRTRKRDTQQDAGANAGLRLDVDYIKRGVDTIQVDLRQMRDNVGELSIRVARVEESAKQAHKRLDEHLKMHLPD